MNAGLYWFIKCVIVGRILGMDRHRAINGFMKRFVHLAVGLILAGVVLCGAAGAQESSPYPRVSQETFRARLAFFGIDPAIPLEARVVGRKDRPGSVREKIVFRGAQGFLVPGYLEFPKAGTKPYPLVLLVHGWSGSKEVWYVDDNIYHGGLMRRALLGAGYAILALDAATHGERSHEIDYQEVNSFNDPNAPPRRNYFTFAEISIQTVKDYQRALDYLKQRGDIDMRRIGLVGYSMGGMDAFYLLSVEPRIKVAVACVPPLFSAGYGPASPIDYTWGIGQTPFLMLMGRQDKLGDPGKVEASFRAYLEGPNSKLIWFDSEHKLPAAYVPDALAWIKRYLPAGIAR
jgi:dienelactone hydrolase